MPSLPISYRQIAVKNTFIAVEDEDRQDIEMHKAGARTCLARLDECAWWHLSNHDTDGPDDEDSSGRSVESTPTKRRTSCSALSDVETFASTPSGSDCDFSRSPSDGSVMDMGGTSAKPPRETISLASVVPPLQARRHVMVQVPVSLPAGFNYSLGDLQAAVTRNCVMRDSMTTIFDVNVALRCMEVPSARPSKPAFIPKFSSKNQKRRRSFPQTPPAALSSPSAANSAVCCHWKNKGWCKYQQACKFLHPEHKRGVGSTSRLIFPVAA